MPLLARGNSQIYGSSARTLLGLNQYALRRARLQKDDSPNFSHLEPQAGASFHIRSFAHIPVTIQDVAQHSQSQILGDWNPPILADKSTMLETIPGPPAYPFIGNVLDVRDEVPVRGFANLADKYGPIYKVTLGGR